MESSHGINLKIGCIYCKKSWFAIFDDVIRKWYPFYFFSTILFLLYQRISVQSFKWIASLSEILARGVRIDPPPPPSTIGSQKKPNPCRVKPLSDTILLWEGHCWIGKNINNKFNCPSSTLKFLFLFGFHYNVSEQSFH